MYYVREKQGNRYLLLPLASGDKPLFLTIQEIQKRRKQGIFIHGVDDSGEVIMYKDKEELILSMLTAWSMFSNTVFTMVTNKTPTIVEEIPDGYTGPVITEAFCTVVLEDNAEPDSEGYFEIPFFCNWVQSKALRDCKHVKFHKDVSTIERDRQNPVVLSMLETLDFSEHTGGLYIFENVFQGAPVLQKIVFADSMEELRIGDDAFAETKCLQSIRFPNGRVTIRDRAFTSSKALESVTFAEGDIHIAVSAFGGCDALKSLTFEETSRRGFTKHLFIDSFAFSTTGLVSVKLPDYTGTVSQKAFEKCSALKEFYLPTGTRVCKDVLHKCDNLRVLRASAKQLHLKAMHFRNDDESCSALELKDGKYEPIADDSIILADVPVDMLETLYAMDVTRDLEKIIVSPIEKLRYHGLVTARRINHACSVVTLKDSLLNMSETDETRNLSWYRSDLLEHLQVIEIEETEGE